MKKRILSIILCLILVACYCGCAVGNVSSKPKFVMEFTYTQKNYEDFEQAANTFEQNIKNNKSTNTLISNYNKLFQIYSFIDDQKSIAEILYYSDLTNQDYIAQKEMVTEAYYLANTKYYALIAEVAKTNSEFKKLLFNGMSQEEINFFTIDKTKINQIKLENSEIIVQMETSDVTDENWIETSNELYYQFVSNNQLMANEYSYNNYYDFMSDKAYMRDYTKADRLKFRQYLKDYIIPLFNVVNQKYDNLKKQLSAEQLNYFDSFYNAPYNQLALKYVQGYVNSMPKTLKAKFNKIFTEPTVIFSDNENSYNGAFTGKFVYYDTPFAFFGKNRQDALTVVHEMGHFGSFYYFEDAEVNYDIAETHSQGNEWLFLSYLNGKLEEKMTEYIILKRLCNGLTDVITCSIVDMFEEAIYCAEEPYLATQYEEVIQSVISYFGKTDLTKYSRYIKMVTFSQPVYYLSYATSELVSISLYCLAQEDASATIEKYRFLQEDVKKDLGFVSMLAEAELPNPFQQEMFTYLTQTFNPSISQVA